MAREFAGSTQRSQTSGQYSASFSVFLGRLSSIRQLGPAIQELTQNGLPHHKQDNAPFSKRRNGMATQRICGNRRGWPESDFSASPCSCCGNSSNRWRDASVWVPELYVMRLFDQSPLIGRSLNVLCYNGEQVFLGWYSWRRGSNDQLAWYISLDHERQHPMRVTHWQPIDAPDKSLHPQWERWYLQLDEPIAVSPP
jgi:hypothetical protein